MAGTKGNCYLCGVELGKIAMKNHILKEHSEPAGGQECRLLKIEGAYNKNYWLYVDVPADDTLSELDIFLREIWLECCGHLSEFRGVSENSKLGQFAPGDSIRHLYDFGDTTETLITVIGPTWRMPQQNEVRLLARNVPPKFSCAVCGKEATKICIECLYETDHPFYCDSCAAQHEHDEMLLPVSNSPRMGACAYCGELDTYTFDPSKFQR